MFEYSWMSWSTSLGSYQNLSRKKDLTTNFENHVHVKLNKCPFFSDISDFIKHLVISHNSLFKTKKIIAFYLNKSQNEGRSWFKSQELHFFFRYLTLFSSQKSAQEIGSSAAFQSRFLRIHLPWRYIKTKLKEYTRDWRSDTKKRKKT